MADDAKNLRERRRRLLHRRIAESGLTAVGSAQPVEHRADIEIDLDEMDAEESFAGSGSARPVLVESVRPERLPLSYSQLAIWFQCRMGAPDAFNMPFALRFDGPLGTAPLAGALNDVVARHEALRTNFVEHDGVPYQVVHPTLQVELAIRKTAADQVDEVVADLRRHVFTLGSEPLIRPTLLVLGADTHVLFLLVHHIVIDQVSLGIFFDDLVMAYRARVDAKESQWEPLPIQFADYALWQRNAFDEANEWGQDELTYWRDALAGLPDEISVAPDHARPPVLGQRGEVVSFTVSAARRAALIQLAEQVGATEFMVYQAVLAVVLHKLGGGSDIAIGSPSASRVDSTTTNVIGLFTNMVVLRNDLSEDRSLRTMIERSRDTVLGAVAHQELPIERLVDALNPPRSRSRNPLFQTMINFFGEDRAFIPSDLTGTRETTAVQLPMVREVSDLDLNLGLHVTPDGGLDVWVVANADLYKPQTVALVADALTAALEAFATTPDCPVSELEVLPTASLEQLLALPTPKVVDSSQPITRGAAETERVLIGLLEGLLGTTGIDREDNFFALGGDSIISIQWSTLASAQGLVLTPAMVFEHMTITGSVSANEATTSPQAIAPSQRAFCSSVPNPTRT